MQRWERPRHRGRAATPKPPNSQHPSFSSTLLDAIYRSMDEDAGALTAGPTMEKPRRVTVDAAAVRKSMTTTEKLVTGRHGERSSVISASTSSTSSSGGFSSSSSSESDSVALPTPPPPKPIRTNDPPWRTPKQSTPEGRKKSMEGSTRVRFRASEFYGELRKAKPPVSPGARLARFLTNLFTPAGNPKKVKTPTAANSDQSGRSAESSHSWSPCHVETPPPSGKTPPSSGGAPKRSVRFYPVGVLVGEEPPTLVAVSVGEALPSAEEERNRAGEAARELVRKYTEKMEIGEEEEGEEEDEDDDGDGDGGSCSSSDLFELESLAAVDGGGGDGGGRERGYLGELPVYGTTRLETNRAIARGLIL